MLGEDNQSKSFNYLGRCPWQLLSISMSLKQNSASFLMTTRLFCWTSNYLSLQSRSYCYLNCELNPIHIFSLSSPFYLSSFLIFLFHVLVQTDKTIGDKTQIMVSFCPLFGQNVPLPHRRAAVFAWKLQYWARFGRVVRTWINGMDSTASGSFYLCPTN